MIPRLKDARFDALRKLAAERFGPVKPAEEAVLQLSASTGDHDPAESRERLEVGAAFLRWLATDKDAAAHIDPLGLRVANATIASPLDLDFCKIPFRLRFRSCTLLGELYLNSAELPAFYFLSCNAERGVFADGLRVQGDVFLDGLIAKGELHFAGARIGGNLSCSGAALAVEGQAFSADGAKINGDVFLDEGFSSLGEVRLLGARIGGDLICSGATLAVKGDALSADTATITGGVFFIKGFSSAGEISFAGTQIGGDLNCFGARIINLRCQHTRLKGSLFWVRIMDPKNSCLNLIGARVKMIDDETASWPAPGKLVVKGLEYGDLAPHEPSTDEDLSANQMARPRPLRAGERIQWLNLQGKDNRLDPQAWIWLAQLFKEKGQDDDARRVLLSYRWRQANAGKWYRWPIRALFAVLSWEPLLILLPFLLILFWGSQTYQRAWDQHLILPTSSDTFTSKPSEAPPAKVDVFAHAYPVFNPWIYTLENELPLVKFGMDDKWAPDPNLVRQGQAVTYWWLAGFRWFLIVAGWVQGILLTFGINRRFHD